MVERTDARTDGRTNERTNVSVAQDKEEKAKKTMQERKKKRKRRRTDDDDDDDDDDEKNNNVENEALNGETIGYLKSQKKRQNMLKSDPYRRGNAEQYYECRIIRRAEETRRDAAKRQREQRNNEDAKRKGLEGNGCSSKRKSRREMIATTKNVTKKKARSHLIATKAKKTRKRVRNFSRRNCSTSLKQGKTSRTNRRIR